MSALAAASRARSTPISSTTSPLVAQAGRVGDRHRQSADLDRLAHDVARRSRDRRDDGAVAADQAIQQRRLAGVRARRGSPASGRDVVARPRRYVSASASRVARSRARSRARASSRVMNSYPSSEKSSAASSREITCSSDSRIAAARPAQHPVADSRARASPGARCAR